MHRGVRGGLSEGRSRVDGGGRAVMCIDSMSIRIQALQGRGRGRGGGRERVAKAKSEKSKGILTGNKLEIVTRRENVEGNKAMADAKASKKTDVEDGCI